MTQFISHLHAALLRDRFTRRGSTLKDASPKGTHKVYERMEKITLPQPKKLEAALGDALRGRSSYRGGSTDVHIPLETWGTLLGYALGKKVETSKRNYPSGGTLYPIETYLFAKIGTAAYHAFHYNPTEHSFEKLRELPDVVDIKQLVPTPKDVMFSALLVFTAVWHRSSAKYGDFAYILSLLEAGHMSQNVLLSAAALHVQSRAMAAFGDEKLIEILDLDPAYEQPVHSIVLSA